MANTLVRQYAIGPLKAFYFNVSSAAGATETLQLPVINVGDGTAGNRKGLKIIGVFRGVFTSATARSETYQYTQNGASAGQLAIGALTASDAFDITVVCDGVAP